MKYPSNLVWLEKNAFEPEKFLSSNEELRDASEWKDVSKSLDTKIIEQVRIDWNFLQKVEKKKWSAITRLLCNKCVYKLWNHMSQKYIWKNVKSANFAFVSFFFNFGGLKLHKSA